MTTTLSLEAQEIVDKVKPTDFCKVAMAALDRGFAVTPLRDKHPSCMGGTPPYNREEIRSIAKDFRTMNAVSCCGVKWTSRS